MSEHSQASSRSDEVTLGELLSQLLRFYARAGRRVLWLALAAALLMALAATLSPRQRVMATLDTPQLTLDLWRSLLPVLAEEQAVASDLAAFEARRGRAVSPTLATLLDKPEFWSSQVQFRMALRRDDLRESPAVDAKTSGPLGLEIVINAGTVEEGIEAVEAVAFHVREAALRLSLRRYLAALEADLGRQRAELRLNQVRTEFDVEQQNRRLGDLRRLLVTYPEAKRLNLVAIAPVADGAGRHLPPLAQLTATEVGLSESRNALRAMERGLEKVDWGSRYLEAVGGQAWEIGSGSALLEFLRQRRDSLLAEPSPTAAAREMALELERNFSDRQALIDQWRLKAAPERSGAILPWRRPVLWGGLAFVAAFVLFSLAVAVAPRLAGRTPG